MSTATWTQPYPRPNDNLSRSRLGRRQLPAVNHAYEAWFAADNGCCAAALGLLARVAIKCAMGMDLKNQDGEWFQCRGTAWGMTLMVARQYGWKPAGTLPPLEEDGTEPKGVHLISAQQPKRLLDWIVYHCKRLTGTAAGYWDTANYHTNDSQRVTEEDAKALAAVLSKVRDEIQGTELQKEYFPDPEAWFTPFVVYLRKGSFSIH